MTISYKQVLTRAAEKVNEPRIGDYLTERNRKQFELWREKLAWYHAGQVPVRPRTQR